MILAKFFLSTDVRSKRMVLAGDLPCSADAWQLLEATLKESAADRPIKAWLVHREREDEGFSVSAASFWNEVSDPRFYHFGGCLRTRVVST